MKAKMLMILVALISIAAIAKAQAQATSTLPTQHNTSTIPTYSLWCVGNPSASWSRLRRSRLWACDNGADCSPMKTGGQCQDLNDYSQVSYAFNDYYQKNPISGNCVFNGAAMLTVQDPSTPTCKFRSNSIGPFPKTSSVTRTATPNLGNLLWGLGLTYLAYVAAQIT